MKKNKQIKKEKINKYKKKNNDNNEIKIITKIKIIKNKQIKKLGINR